MGLSVQNQHKQQSAMSLPLLAILAIGVTCGDVPAVSAAAHIAQPEAAETGRSDGVINRRKFTGL
ncbi:MAG: hypothetical protein AAF337_04520 [Pseudomonadota bacterium]